jgi:hypothetical protein
MHEMEPDYQRTWLFHISPFQISGWNLLHKIVLNQESNAIQMYMFPPYLLRSLHFTDLGPRHAVAGWEVPLEQTQLPTLMKNAAMADILKVLHSDNNLSGDNRVSELSDRPEWLQNTTKPSISTEQLRLLKKEIDDKMKKEPGKDLPRRRRGSLSRVSGRTLARTVNSVSGLHNRVSAWAQHGRAALAAADAEVVPPNSRANSLPPDNIEPPGGMEEGERFRPGRDDDEVYNESIDAPSISSSHRRWWDVQGISEMEVGRTNVNNLVRASMMNIQDQSGMVEKGAVEVALNELIGELQVVTDTTHVLMERGVIACTRLYEPLGKENVEKLGIAIKSAYQHGRETQGLSDQETISRLSHELEYTTLLIEKAEADKNRAEEKAFMWRGKTSTMKQKISDLRVKVDALTDQLAESRPDDELTIGNRRSTGIGTSEFEPMETSEVAIQSEPAEIAHLREEVRVLGRQVADGRITIQNAEQHYIKLVSDYDLLKHDAATELRKFTASNESNKELMAKSLSESREQYENLKERGTYMLTEKDAEIHGKNMEINNLRLDQQRLQMELSTMESYVKLRDQAFADMVALREAASNVASTSAADISEDIEIAAHDASDAATNVIQTVAESTPLPYDESGPEDVKPSDSRRGVKKTPRSKSVAAKHEAKKIEMDTSDLPSQRYRTRAQRFTANTRDMDPDLDITDRAARAVKKTVSDRKKGKGVEMGPVWTPSISANATLPKMTNNRDQTKGPIPLY